MRKNGCRTANYSEVSPHQALLLIRVDTLLKLGATDAHRWPQH